MIPDEYHNKKYSKAPLELVDPEFMEGLAWALQHGDKKHADTHWKDGVFFEDVISAIERHLASIKRGERFDEDSGLSHTYLASAGLMFIAYYDRHERKYKKFDNRRWVSGNHRRKGPDSSSSPVGGQRLSIENPRRHFSETSGGSRGTIQDPGRSGRIG